MHTLKLLHAITPGSTTGFKKPDIGKWGRLDDSLSLSPLLTIIVIIHPVVDDFRAHPQTLPLRILPAARHGLLHDDEQKKALGRLAWSQRYNCTSTN